MKKDVDEELLDAARERGIAALRTMNGVGEFAVFGNTRVHLIMKGQSETGRPLCLKVNLRAIRAEMDGGQKPADRTELQAFEKIGNQADWAPKVIAASDDGSWFLREWVGDFTSDRVRKTDWNRVRLDDLWRLFADAFAVFHAKPEPFLIRDIKPTNVSCDSDRLYLFDFNTTKSLDRIKRSKIGSRLGNRSNNYTAPELLRAQFAQLACSADYFAFASVFHRYATGRSSAIWTNCETDETAAIRVYRDEFEALRGPFEAALADHGYLPHQITFLTGCLNPLADQRPQEFLLPG